MTRAVGGEHFAEVRQAKLGAVLLDKAVNPISPVAVTVGALDFQHRDPVGDIPESNGAAVAHRIKASCPDIARRIGSRGNAR